MGDLLLLTPTWAKPGSTKSLLLRLDPDLAGRLQAVADVEGRRARPGIGAASRRPGCRCRRAAAMRWCGNALVRQRPLRRGNQQVALAAMLQFLALNGQEMEPGPAVPVAAMVTQLAVGTLDIREVADRHPSSWPR